MTIRDEGHRITDETVLAIALETWTPPRDADPEVLRDYPVHRLLFDAKSCELSVQWESKGYGWNLCEHKDLHLPIFGERIDIPDADGGL